MSQADPHETKNLAAGTVYATTLHELRAKVGAWMKAQGDKGEVFGKPRLLATGSRGQPDTGAMIVGNGLE